MSSLPIPLLSLLRRFISEISLTRHRNPSSRPKANSILASLLRAASIPSLGYLFGWNAPYHLSSTPSGSTEVKQEEMGNMSNGNKGESRFPQQSPLKNKPEEKPPLGKKSEYDPNSPIYQLMNNPVLIDPIRPPRNPIVLSHGLYGFDVRGFAGLPSIQIHYWSDVLGILRKKIGADVIVTRAPSTGSIQERAAAIHDYLKKEAAGKDLNFIAHSMGGLDCRHLISNIKPSEYNPLALMTVCTPHRGSPFMDWLKEHIGIGKSRIPLPGITPTSPSVPLPASIVSFIDSPAYSNLTSNYLNVHFNPSTPDSPNVKYYSIAARTPGISFFHPLFIPKLVLDSYEEKLWDRMKEEGRRRERVYGNDGLVAVESAKWGEFLGVLEECDHWDIRGAGGLAGHYTEEIKDKSQQKEEKTWNWSEWQTFLGLWSRIRTTSKDREDKFGKGDEKSMEKAANAAFVAGLEDPGMKRGVLEAATRDKDKEKDKSNTMEQVLDWVVDNVPGVETVTGSWKGIAERSAVLGAARETQDINKEEEGTGRMKPPRFDLEKFYIALSRKLYDDGF